MTASVQIVPMKQLVEPRPRQSILNVCTNKNGYWCSDLSPFKIGPCNLYDGFVSQNMENAWQFSKVYRRHLDWEGEVDEAYWTWAEQGWDDQKAHRYPMGRGAKPEFSFWYLEKFNAEGKHIVLEPLRLGYIDARKTIYAPLYAEAVMKTEGWRRLKALYETQDELVLRDYDGYDHKKLGRTLTEVLNDPTRKMGHAFVLAMLLTNDLALEQCKMRTP